MNTRLLIAHAHSPIHCGTGQAIGGIDLPIAREKPTNLPLVPGSSLKGVLRARGSDKEPAHLAVFGPTTEKAADHAGSVQFSDLLLAFLPVRSLRGTFAWVTSPFILRRLRRDAREAGLELGVQPPEPRSGEVFTTGPRLEAEGRVVFEDFDFAAKREETFRALARRFARRLFADEDAEEERRHFVDRACLVHDDVMGLLLRSCTEISARIRLDPDAGTVERGALWTEEALPVESLLVGLATATPVRQKDGKTPSVESLFAHVSGLLSSPVQLGGNATVGRGLCRLTLVEV